MKLLALMYWPRSSLGNYVLLPEFPLQLFNFTTCPKTLWTDKGILFLVLEDWYKAFCFSQVSQEEKCSIHTYTHTYICMCVCIFINVHVLLNSKQLSTIFLRFRRLPSNLYLSPCQKKMTLCQIHQPDCLRDRKSWYQCLQGQQIWSSVQQPVLEKGVWNWKIPGFCNKWKTWDWGNNSNKVEMSL